MRKENYVNRIVREMLSLMMRLVPTLNVLMRTLALHIEVTHTHLMSCIFMTTVVVNSTMIVQTWLTIMMILHIHMMMKIECGERKHASMHVNETVTA